MTEEQKERFRVGVYIRVSRPDQMKGFGLETQERDLEQFVKDNERRGWFAKQEWIFIEQGTGGDTDRSELKRMLKMAYNKELDIILVWKLDRISRSLSDLIDIFERLHKKNVGIVSYKENFDFTGIMGKLVFQIFGAIAEFERGTISLRTAEGKKSSALAGNYVGGGCPYGFKRAANKGDKKGSKLVMVKEEAEVVRNIFNWFVFDKMNRSQIAKRLNDLSIPKGVGGQKRHRRTKWSDVTIYGMLRNDVYHGLVIVNRFSKFKRNQRSMRSVLRRNG